MLYTWPVQHVGPHRHGQGSRGVRDDNYLKFDEQYGSTRRGPIGRVLGYMPVSDTVYVKLINPVL